MVVELATCQELLKPLGEAGTIRYVGHITCDRKHATNTFSSVEETVAILCQFPDLRTSAVRACSDLKMPSVDILQ